MSAYVGADALVHGVLRATTTTTTTSKQEMHKLTGPTALLFPSLQNYQPTAETKKEYTFMLAKKFSSKGQAPLAVPHESFQRDRDQRGCVHHIMPRPGRLASPRLAPCRQGKKPRFGDWAIPPWSYSSRPLVNSVCVHCRLPLLENNKEIV